jgi:hypothetical protein
MFGFSEFGEAVGMGSEPKDILPQKNENLLDWKGKP